MKVKRTALVSAVAFLVAYALWLIFLLSAVPEFQWQTAVSILLDIPSRLALPALLIILWRSNATLMLPVRLRRLALATMISSGALFVGFTVPILWIWIWAGAFRTAGITWLLAGAPGPLSDAAVALLGLALFRHRDELPQSVPRQSRLLRQAAGITTLLSAFFLVWGVAAYPINLATSVKGWSSAPAVQIVESIAFQAIRDACRLAAAYIIYRMQPPVAREAVQAASA